MPVQDFINKFLPRSTSTDMPSSADAFKNVPTMPTKQQTEFYDRLKKTKKKSKIPSRCPGFVFKNTSNRASIWGDELWKPDICCYAEQTVNLAVASNGKPLAHLGYAELFIDVKKTPDHDFFNDPPDDADRSEHQFILDIADKGICRYATMALAQNVAYATEACARQHRTFYLSMSLAGTFMRFIRWDCAGAIASESFDIHEQPELLCNFLWRFAHASATERGHDPTVEFAAAGDEARFRETISRRIKFETGFAGKELDDAINEHYQPGVVTVINVEDNLGKHTERLLVSRPVVSPFSVSRAMRGYWAVTTENEVVFLKDNWRDPTLHQEGENIEDMEKANVVNIPKILIHGDVPAPPRKKVSRTATAWSRIQHTQTDKFTGCNWVCRGGRVRSVSGYTHYRLVSKTVGYPLKHFVDAGELLQGTFDAYEAMTSAYVNNRRLHRDISIGNIILVRETEGTQRRGILIDWELSSIIEDDGDVNVRHSGRTGTWYFMSIRLLEGRPCEGPWLSHTIQDDMESMLWVVLYCGFRWLPVEVQAGRSLTGTARALFEHYDHNDTINFTAGGNWKLLNTLDRTYTDRVKFKCQAFREFCETMMDYHRPRQHLKEELAGKWDRPADLQSFWKEFLKTNGQKLVGESSEKCDNKVAMTPTARPFQATLTGFKQLPLYEAAPPAPSRRGLKRKAGGEAGETGVVVKRTRVTGDPRPVQGRTVQTRSMKKLGAASGVAESSDGAARDALGEDPTVGEP
ncbi:hypothetical protein B0H21DRAFT_693419 [Amylocystis lapponica]|nr:hypothetical protein B0H21DRAFT_693419 [Amylocystis lapponica]